MWFAGNGIGDDGAKQLAKRLVSNTTLTSLDLRGTRCYISIHTYVWVFYHDAIVALTLTLMLVQHCTLTLTVTLTTALTLTLKPTRLEESL